MPKCKQLINDGCPAWWDFEEEFSSSGIFHQFYKTCVLYLKKKQKRHVQIQIKNIL